MAAAGNFYTSPVFIATVFFFLLLVFFVVLIIRQKFRLEKQLSKDIEQLRLVRSELDAKGKGRKGANEAGKTGGKRNL